jgi:hypothetical protein
MYTPSMDAGANPANELVNLLYPIQQKHKTKKEKEKENGKKQKKRSIPPPHRSRRDEPIAWTQEKRSIPSTRTQVHIPWTQELANELVSLYYTFFYIKNQTKQKRGNEKRRERRR